MVLLVDVDIDAAVVFFVAGLVSTFIVSYR